MRQPEERTSRQGTTLSCKKILRLDRASTEFGAVLGRTIVFGMCPIRVTGSVKIELPASSLSISPSLLLPVEVPTSLFPPSLRIGFVEIVSFKRLSNFPGLPGITRLRDLVLCDVGENTLCRNAESALLLYCG